MKHALREAEVYYNMDVNCLDPLGRSALLIAIENENLEIMELLLDHGIHTGDALLYAIRKEVVGAVELLLSHKRPSGEKQVRADVSFLTTPKVYVFWFVVNRLHIFSGPIWTLKMFLAAPLVQTKQRGRVSPPWLC